MGRRGALPPLVAQLSSAFPDVQHYASRALYRLAANSENHARIRIEGGIGPLIELLTSKHEPCQRCAVMALCNLATDANNCAAMVIQGAILPLVTMLDHDSVPCARCVCSPVHCPHCALPYVLFVGSRGGCPAPPLLDWLLASAFVEMMGSAQSVVFH